MIEVDDKSKCCGCSACVQICPKHCLEMKKDNEGFFYPVVENHLCIDCGLCEKVCPELKQFDSIKPTKVYAAINPDDEVREESSSGGIFSMLAERTIAKGGVVFGARFNKDWQVEIVAAESVDETVTFRGSKYVQARVGDSYKVCKQYLENGRSVLYSGTPCQISGLQHFLQKKYDNLLTVDFICHGVPSPSVWNRYLDEVVTAGDKALRDTQFRNNKKGWKQFSFQINYDKKENEVTLLSEAKENPFMIAFLSNLILRPSCHACPAKNGKSNSDMTIADFWGIQNVNPAMYDNRGTSMIIVHTEKGFDAIPFNNMRYEEVPVDSLRFNQSYAKSSVPNGRRSEFFSMFYSTNDLHKLIAHLLRPTFRQKVKNYKYHLRSIKRLIIRLLTRDYSTRNHERLHLVDKDIINSFDSKTVSLLDVNFRDKRNGWKSYSVTLKLKYK